MDDDVDQVETKDIQTAKIIIKTKGNIRQPAPTVERLKAGKPLDGPFQERSSSLTKGFRYYVGTIIKYERHFVGVAVEQNNANRQRKKCQNKWY